MSVPAPLVCLFCHADDEYPVFAEIDAQLAAGGRVVCIYLTDGAFYEGQDAEARADESRRVLARMGVAAGDVHFPGLSLPVGDTKLYLHMDAALGAIRALMPSPSTGVRLLLPAWEGGHHDHDALHILGLIVSAEFGVDDVLQASLYHGRALPGGLFRVLDPIPENGPVVYRPMPFAARLRYLGYCLSYPSQWKTWLALFPGVLWKYLTVGGQELQRVSPARVLEPPHAGRVLYERRRFITWETFAEATRPWRERAGKN